MCEESMIAFLVLFSIPVVMLVIFYFGTKSALYDDNDKS